MDYFLERRQYPNLKQWEYRDYDWDSYWKYIESFDLPFEKLSSIVSFTSDFNQAHHPSTWTVLESRLNKAFVHQLREKYGSKFSDIFPPHSLKSIRSFNLDKPKSFSMLAAIGSGAKAVSAVAGAGTALVRSGKYIYDNFIKSSPDTVDKLGKPRSIQEPLESTSASHIQYKDFLQKSLTIPSPPSTGHFIDKFIIIPFANSPRSGVRSVNTLELDIILSFYGQLTYELSLGLPRINIFFIVYINRGQTVINPINPELIRPNYVLMTPPRTSAYVGYPQNDILAADFLYPQDALKFRNIKFPDNFNTTYQQTKSLSSRVILNNPVELDSNDSVELAIYIGSHWQAETTGLTFEFGAAINSDISFL